MPRAIGDARASCTARSLGVLLLPSLLLILAACASRPRGATTSAAGAGHTSNAADRTMDAGSLRACAHDAKDVTPCMEDCDRGLASGCATLATRVEQGNGIARDLTRAVTLHERACELRDPSSCVVAARMHASGRGVVPNRARQMELLGLACTLGDPAACSIPARAFEGGVGVTRDPRRAHDLWERACTGGIETACDALSDAGI